MKNPNPLSQFRYKCRMCDQDFNEGMPMPRDEARLKLIHLMAQDTVGVENVDKLGRFTIHYHNNGSIGFAILVGFGIIDPNYDE